MIEATEIWDIKDCNIHHFSDASKTLYANKSGNIHCTLLPSKSRVAHIKYVSTPRLELTAATFSVRILKILQKKIDAELTCNMTEYY